MPFVRRAVVGALVAGVCWASLPAQEKPAVNPALFSELRWRAIGPHRASRTVAAGGQPHRPITFYNAHVNRGVR